MNPLIRWGKFNLVGAMGMVVQLAALALFNRALADARAVQYRVRLDAGDREHGGKQCVLVFAIAILVGEYLSGGVGLVSSDAKVDADVANLGGYITVEGSGFIFVGGVLPSKIEPRRGGSAVSPGRSEAESWVCRKVPESPGDGTVLTHAL